MLWYYNIIPMYKIHITKSYWLASSCPLLLSFFFFGRIEQDKESGQEELAMAIDMSSLSL